MVEEANIKSPLHCLAQEYGTRRLYSGIHYARGVMGPHAVIARFSSKATTIYLHLTVDGSSSS